MKASTTSSSREISSLDTDICLANLPHEHLIAIADYLPKSSCALLAVALTAPSKSFRLSNWEGELGDATKAIISSTTSATLSHGIHDYEHHELGWNDRWNQLHFGENEQLLCKKLCDDDIGAVLVCIDAKNNLKTLGLSSIDIIGYALEPLRESAMLERIFFKQSSRRLSTSVVVPVLDSIIDTSGITLPQYTFIPVVRDEDDSFDAAAASSIVEFDAALSIVLPDEWTEGKARFEQPLNGFLAKVNQLVNNEGKCFTFNCDRRGDEGHQSCFICFKSLCNHCNVHRTDDPILRCDHCGMTLCRSCDEFANCRICNSTFCSVCKEKDNVEAAIRCDSCAGQICFGCVSPDQECKACLGMFYSRLLARNEELGDEIRGLCEENDTQKAKIADLNQEVDGLRKQLNLV